ncbi:transcriptional regulator, LacI family [Marininema mesophilum]|uniref:Transcriptional regulator, LacI family n=1 Tax=Marininema mesophilum TaxID=1048340 RepID=A0A1H2ZYZ9_9BACL|nr:LacI family DNA-binding transcriptional regulator [Marininema mesophilum]SDX22730.1 transcriptional regulator, LacI family [Marininema mesophilum]
MTTIHEVAKQARVSVATVSRILNETGYVRSTVKARVRQVIREMNYKPEVTRYESIDSQTATIAMILPDISNPFFAELARAVEDAAREYDYTVILCNSDDFGFREKTYIHLLHRRAVEGIIFVSRTLGEREMTLMEEQGLPFVLLDRTPRIGDTSVIRSNNVDGARIAVRHLLEVGCQRVAHIAGPVELIPAMERHRGYLDEVESLSWFHPSWIVPGGFSVAGGMKATQLLLERFPDMDGIFAGNDLMAVGALKALHRAGVDVPFQVALCGFDGISVTALTEPELTTVAQPIEEFGKVAVSELMLRIKGEEVVSPVEELEVTLLKRDSTRRIQGVSGSGR